MGGTAGASDTAPHVGAGSSEQSVSTGVVVADAATAAAAEE